MATATKRPRRAAPPPKRVTVEVWLVHIYENGKYYSTSEYVRGNKDGAEAYCEAYNAGIHRRGKGFWAEPVKYKLTVDAATMLPTKK